MNSDINVTFGSLRRHLQVFPQSSTTRSDDSLGE